MIDIELLRKQPELFRDSLKRRDCKTEIIDRFLELDARWRQAIQALEDFRKANSAETLLQLHKEGKTDELKETKARFAIKEADERKIRNERQQLLLQIPNLILEQVPTGERDSANKVVRAHGELKSESEFSHEELMTHLGWLDLELAAATSGSRFRFLKGAGALAHLKLMMMAIGLAVENGFTPIIPPVLAKNSLLEQGGFFPGGEDEVFKIGDDLNLLGTSEPMLIALSTKKRFTPDQLPVRFVGFSTCFRKEAGSYGKDTTGIFRQHQFDKVEMVSVVAPGDSEKEHQFLVEIQEKIVQKLGLPYQVVLIGSGDLGAKEAKKYDIETWFPSQKCYRETHSASNCTDFQTRRFGIKVRDNDGQDVFAHALNATLATERLLLSTIENNQRSDKTVVLPEVLT